MLKIFSSRISGYLTPASLDKSLISSLALATVSDTVTEIRYKGLSDEVMCAVNALECMGALISVSKESLTVNPATLSQVTSFFNFCESDKAFLMLVPFIKKHVSCFDAEYSHEISSKKLKELISVLEDSGCKTKSNGVTLSISERLLRKPSRIIEDKDISDGMALCGFAKGSDSVKNAVDFFKTSKASPFTADADLLYLSYFIMASSFIDCEYDVPKVLKPFVITEFKNGIYRHTPKLQVFTADASVLGEFFLPCVLLAQRTGGTCTFEKYRAPSAFHSRLMQMLGDIGVKCKLERGAVLTVNAQHPLECKRIRAWNDERFVITSCLTSCLLNKDTVLDSERAILRRYPTFFDDFTLLGGAYQQL